MNNVADTVQQIVDLTKQYAQDMDGLVTGAQDKQDALDQEIADLVEQKKEIAQQLATDVAERTKQFLQDLKAIIEPAPEPIKLKGKSSGGNG